MLYYSHVNEDNTVERMLLGKTSLDKVVAVAGSGERVLALMDNTAVKRVVALDVNREALFLLELKLAALTALSVKDYLSFIGHTRATSQFRQDCFDTIASCLTPECRRYWQEKLNWLKAGILCVGHFENFLAGIRPLMIFWLGKDFLRLLKEPDFTLGAFSKLKWKFLAWSFSRKWIYWVAGNRDEAFFGAGSDVRIIPNALTTIIANGKASSSFMVHLIFKGHLRDMLPSLLPPSLQVSVLSKIKERLLEREVSVKYEHSDLLKYVKAIEGDKPAFYSLSDILSFNDHDYLAEVLENIPGKDKTVIVVRAFLRNRLSFVKLKELVRKYRDIAFQDEHDLSGMYQVIEIQR